MSWANFGEPATLVRSPMFRKLMDALVDCRSGVSPDSLFCEMEMETGETPVLLCVFLWIVSASSPLRRRQGSITGTFRGGKSRTASAMALMCGGVESQQPPTMLSQPFCAHSLSCGASVSGVSGKPVGNSGFGRPAFGKALTEIGALPERSSRSARSDFGPSAQFMPSESRGTWETEFQNASTVCPVTPRLLPAWMKVTEASMGMHK